MAPKDLLIYNLTGGLNDTDSPTSLPPNQATVAENVEFHVASRTEHATIAARRAGTSAITTPITAGADISLIHRHMPTTDPTAAEFWAADFNAGAITLRYKDTAWHTVTTPTTLSVANDDPYNLRMQSLHSKLFLAGNHTADRMLVRVAGASVFRLAGLAEPAAPTVAETGVGTFSGVRYYRVRYNVTSGSTVLLRSEPSDVTTYDPAAFGSNGLSARITKPASIVENETHWEVEASLDNANFYRIATVLVGTTTYDDSVSFSTGYAATAGTVLSEDVGDYIPISSGKFVVADDDRLLIGASWENAAYSARVAWTPVLNDPGVGNDERSPVDTDNFIDLDTYEGGELTGLSRTVNGYIFAFKWGHIYQLTRTGQRTRAYSAHCLTKNRGAVPGSIVEGLDQNGRPALYFLDPQVGPCRIGEGGIQTCGLDIRKTWETVNKSATVIARGLFYPDASQVQWSIATSAATTPNLSIVLHVDKCKTTPDGVRQGWVKWNGTRATALSTCLFADNIEAGVARSQVYRPYIALADGTIHRCDTGTTDNGTTYSAKIRSAPVLIDILNLFGVMEAALVAKAASGVTIDIKPIRNFGEETKTYDVILTPDASEDPVIKYIDNLDISELYAIQFEFSDQTVPSGSWCLYMFAAGLRRENS